MRVIRHIAIFVGIAAATVTAKTQPRQQRLEASFTIKSAVVQKFARPLPSRKGAYREALVVRVEALTSDLDAMPPALVPYLYIGNHELLPHASAVDGDVMVLTFHDPAWQSLQDGAPMVLTVRSGDPIRNPDRYRNYPRFDPGIIERR
jgi:hypothetical protein